MYEIERITCMRSNAFYISYVWDGKYCMYWIGRLDPSERFYIKNLYFLRLLGFTADVTEDFIGREFMFRIKPNYVSFFTKLRFVLILPLKRKYE